MAFTDSRTPITDQYGIDFFSFRPSCRTKSLTRIREPAGALNASGRPDSGSQQPTAAKKMIRLLRRQLQKSFGHRLTSTVRTAPLVRPRRKMAQAAALHGARGGRTCGREGRLRSSICSKVLGICLRRRRLIFTGAEGCRDLYQASRVCSKRRPVPGFEPGILFSTKVETTKFFCIPQATPRSGISSFALNSTAAFPDAVECPQRWKTSGGSASPSDRG